MSQILFEIFIIVSKYLLSFHQFNCNAVGIVYSVKFVCLISLCWVSLYFYVYIPFFESCFLWQGTWNISHFLFILLFALVYNNKISWHKELKMSEKENGRNKMARKENNEGKKIKQVIVFINSFVILFWFLYHFPFLPAI